MSAELRQAVERARARWPGVDFDERAFTAFLAQKAIAPQARAPERLEELALTHACLTQRPGAHAALEATFGAMVNEAIGRAGPSLDKEEVLQRLRLRLFTETPARNAKIGEFLGEGALGAWLRTVATRVALTMLTPNTHDDIDDHLRRMVLDLPSPEERVLRSEAREALKTALGLALQQLDGRQRTLIKLAGVDGLTLEQIGVVYGVHKATTSRWLAAIRTQLLRSTQAIMREQLKLSPDEVFSLVGAAGSQLELSIARLLKTTEEPGR